ncbi:Ferrochelatase, protoheme ferro-lyase [Staphylococcus aureus]|nr:Ferrochelatase, protoheme ferro-lyase [Staphylococcus aureus]
MTKKMGLLVMAYGTPYKESDISHIIQTLDMVNVHLKKNFKI